MEPLTIQEDIKTPAISFDPITGIMEIRGKSIPENSLEFYKPIFGWLDEYCRQPARKTEMSVILDYFNTSSSKCLLDIFRKLENANTAGSSSVKVRWHYEPDDEDMMEAGEDYQALISLPFEMIKL